MRNTAYPYILTHWEQYRQVGCTRSDKSNKHIKSRKMKHFHERLKNVKYLIENFYVSHTNMPRVRGGQTFFFSELRLVLDEPGLLMDAAPVLLLILPPTDEPYQRSQNSIQNMNS